MANWVVTIKAAIADLITRVKGLDDIHDDLVVAQASLDTVERGTRESATVNDAGPGAGGFNTTLTVATNDHYNDMLIVFTSGVLTGEACRISDYTGVTKKIFVPAPYFSGPPGNGDAFDVIATYHNGQLSGVAQIAHTTEDLEQAAASYDLFTGTTQDVILESLVIRLPNVDVSDDVNITSISIQDDDVTPHVIISAVQGAKANLTAEAEISWTGAMLIKVGTKVQLTIAGGAADAPTVCDIVAKCRAVIDGGYLA